MSDQQNNAGSGGKGGLTTTHAILIVGILVVVAILIVGFMFLSRGEEAAPPVETRTGNYVVDEDNLEQVVSEMTQKAEEGMFTTYMNTVWTFPSGKKASTDAVVGNFGGNNYDFIIEVSLTDTSELIYTSSLVPIGGQIKEIVLDTPLAQGEYEAICTYRFVDENGNLNGNSVEFYVDILVES